MQGDALGSRCWGWAVRVQNGVRHSQPLFGLCSGLQQLPLPRAPGREWCRMLPVLLSVLQQSQTALPALGAPWAWTSEARASLLSSLEEMGGCWVGFYGVCMDSQALHCCLPVASWDRPAFPARLVGKESCPQSQPWLGGCTGLGTCWALGHTKQAGSRLDPTGVASNKGVGACRGLVVLHPPL